MSQSSDSVPDYFSDVRFLVPTESITIRKKTRVDFSITKGKHCFFVFDREFGRKIY